MLQDSSSAMTVFSATKHTRWFLWNCIKMTEEYDKDGHFLLVYGSQTGQAKAIAEEVQQTAADKGLSPALYCFSQFEKTVRLYCFCTNVKKNVNACSELPIFFKNMVLGSWFGNCHRTVLMCGRVTEYI